MTAARTYAAGAKAAVALALTAALACASARGPAADPYAAPVLPVREGATVSGQILPGHPHVFPLPLEEGTYVEIYVDRPRSEVEAALIEPGASLEGPAEAAYVSGEVAPDSRGQVLWEVARESGLHHVRLTSQSGDPRPFNLTLSVLRASTDRDLCRHRGLEIFLATQPLADAGKTEEALEGFRRARDLFRCGEYDRGIAAASVARARAFQKLRKFDEARDEFRDAKEHWRRGGDLRSVAGTLISLGNLERQATHWKAAEVSVDEGIRLAHEIGAADIEANGFSQRCGVLFASGRYGDATAACSESAALQEELGKPRQLVDDLIILGALARVRGDFESARGYLSRAQDILHDSPSAPQEATVTNDLAILLDFEGQYLDALADYQKALEIYDALGEASFAGTVLANMGTVYQRLGDLDATLEYCRQSLARIEEGGDTARRIETLHNLGWVLIQRGRLEEATATLQEALALARRLDSAPLLAASMERIGELQLARDQPAMAVATLNEALARYQACDSGWREPAVLVLLSRAKAALGDYEPALELLAQAADRYAALGRRSSVAETFYLRAKMERGRGNLAAARQAVEQALADAEAVRPRAGSDELRTLLSATTRPYYELYVEVLMEQHRASPKAGHDAEALRESERSRARSLREILPEAALDLGHEVPDTLLSARTSVLHRLNAKEVERQSLLHAEEPTARAVFSINLDLEALLTELQEVERKIRLASPRYAALTRPEPVSVGEIQRTLLDPETSLLEYSLGQEESFLWAVTGDSFRVYDLPPRRQIEDAARCVHWLITAYGTPPRPADLGTDDSACLGRNAAAYREADKEDGPLHKKAASRRAIREAFARQSRALSEILLGPPAQDGLLRFRLAVVSDGALEYVPFAALPSPLTARALLVETHELVRLPSASVLAFQRDHPAPPTEATRALAIVADPVYGPSDVRLAGNLAAAQSGEPSLPHDRDAPTTSFSRLDFSRREAHAIAALAPPDQTLLMTDFDASRSAVVDGALSGARYVHFATHGVIDTRYPQLSSLVLSLVDQNGTPDPDGYLRLHDIYGLDLDDADMVVLSACDTALGREIRGEGLVGLTRGFLYAGAERVVASLWQVQDRATADLMERLYRGLLQEGRSPADALRHAQLETLSSETGDYSFPYYWAGFVLQGEWR